MPDTTLQAQLDPSGTGKGPRILRAITIWQRGWSQSMCRRWAKARLRENPRVHA